MITTGCRKTVIFAFDYARFCKENHGKKNRLLFVVHREEILEQSIETFRGVLHDLNFGDLWVGGHKPSAFISSTDVVYFSTFAMTCLARFSATAPLNE